MKKVIIIGAGILGVTTAYRLAKFGIQVILIDQVGQGFFRPLARGGFWQVEAPGKLRCRDGPGCSETVCARWTLCAARQRRRRIRCNESRICPGWTERRWEGASSARSETRSCAFIPIAGWRKRTPYPSVPEIQGNPEEIPEKSGHAEQIADQLMFHVEHSELQLRLWNETTRASF